MINAILSFIFGKPFFAGLIGVAILALGGTASYFIGRFVGVNNQKSAIERAVSDAVRGERERSNQIISQQNNTIEGMVQNVQDWQRTYEAHVVETARVSNMVAEQNRRLDVLTRNLQDEETIIVGTCDATANGDLRDGLRNNIIAEANSRPD